MNGNLHYDITASLRAGDIGHAVCKTSDIAFDCSSGSSTDLAGPAELFAAAFAACVLKNVQRFSEMLRFVYESAEVRVTAERQEAPPRMTRLRYELRLVTDEPERRVDLLHRNIRQHGTIYNTVAAVCEVEGTIVVVAPVWAGGAVAH